MTYSFETQTQLAAERVVEVLERGWCRRDLAQRIDSRYGRVGVAPASPDARWFCLLGAVRRVESEADAIASAYGEYHENWTEGLYERLHRTALYHEAQSISEWNDGYCLDGPDAISFVKEAMGPHGWSKPGSVKERKAEVRMADTLTEIAGLLGGE